VRERESESTPSTYMVLYFTLRNSLSLTHTHKITCLRRTCIDVSQIFVHVFLCVCVCVCVCVYRTYMFCFFMPHPQNPIGGIIYYYLLLSLQVSVDTLYTHIHTHTHTHTRCYAQTHKQNTHTHTHTQVPSLRSILPSSTLFRPPMTTGESTAVYIHIHIYIHTYIHTREDTSSFTRTRKVARTPSLQSFSSSLLFMPCCRLEPQRERE